VATDEEHLRPGCFDDREVLALAQRLQEGLVEVRLGEALCALASESFS
jgi:hypothetical protein